MNNNCKENQMAPTHTTITIAELTRLRDLASLVVVEVEVECPTCLEIETALMAGMVGANVPDDAFRRAAIMTGGEYDPSKCPHCHGTGKRTVRKPGPLLDMFEGCIDLLAECIDDDYCQSKAGISFAEMKQTLADAKRKAGLED